MKKRYLLFCLISLFVLFGCTQKTEQYNCTLSVDCKTILSNLDNFSEDKIEVLPQDGVIFEKQEISFFNGESVFDVLKRAMINNETHLEFSITPIYNSVYIEGINNIYEFDCGELSGWMYKVNGRTPNISCSEYYLRKGDIVEFVYTCDLGKDIEAIIE